jgi:hypothetical protein
VNTRQLEKLKSLRNSDDKEGVQQYVLDIVDIT